MRCSSHMSKRGVKSANKGLKKLRCFKRYVMAIKAIKAIKAGQDHLKVRHTKLNRK